MPADHPAPADPRGPADDLITTTAADWLARRDAGWRAAEAAEFARWRAADPQHERAIRELESAQALLARLPEAPGAAAMFAEIDALTTAHARRRWRRTVIRATGGLAAAAALAFAIGLPLRSERATVFATATETRAAIDLPDGSTLALSAHTEVRVEFRRHERRLDLEQGEAHFSVAKDHTRPFVVSVGPVTVEAIGTAFTIRRNEADVDVSVTEGQVRVTRADPTADRARPPASLELAAGERARIPTVAANGTGDAAVQAFVVTATTTRAAPQIVFADTPFDEAIAQFNRHSRVQMEIGDPALHAKRLGGNFQADNAEAFINLLLASGEVAVERVSETRVILRLAPRER